MATVGQAQAGQALMVGRWVDGTTVEAKSAPARTAVGGGGLSEDWQSGPSFDITSGDSQLMVHLARLLRERAALKGGNVAIDEVREIFDGFSTGRTTDHELRALVERVIENEADLQLAGSDPWCLESSYLTELSKLRSYLKERVLTAATPLPLPDLAQEVYREFGTLAKESSWFGTGSFGRVIKGIVDRRIVASWDPPPGYVFDSQRHDLPGGQGGVVDREESTRSRFAEETGVPLLTSAQYGAVYGAIAAEVNENGYVLTRVTRVVRDKLAAAGEAIPRSAVSFVTKGIWNHGHRFDGEVAEIPQTLAHHFYCSAMYLSEQAEVGLTDEEANEIRDWLMAGYSLEERMDDVTTLQPRSGSQDELGPAVEREGEHLEGDKMDR